eukprot:1159563-Pelagomonas_calceolata.AAC.7
MATVPAATKPTPCRIGTKGGLNFHLCFGPYQLFALPERRTHAPQRSAATGKADGAPPAMQT